MPRLAAGSCPVAVFLGTKPWCPDARILKCGGIPMRHFVILVAFLAVLLVGCGSGGDGDTAPPQVATSPATEAPSLDAATPVPSRTPLPQPEMQSFKVPAGSRPHDVAPAADGGVW